MGAHVLGGDVVEELFGAEPLVEELLEDGVAGLGADVVGGGHALEVVLLGEGLREKGGVAFRRRPATRCGHLRGGVLWRSWRAARAQGGAHGEVEVVGERADERERGLELEGFNLG